MSTIKWSDAAVTPEGLELQAELLKGGGLEFTRVTGADANGENKATLSIQPATVEGSKITVPVLLNNTDLTVGFTMTQIRFYAKGTGAAPGYEILYAVAQDADGDYIPSAAESPGFTIDWSYTFQLGNADNVTVVLDPAGLVSMSLVGQANGLATLDGNGQVPLSQLTAMIQGTSIAAEYDSESAYAKGDYCVKDGLLYKASVDIESPEAWHEDHWSAVNIMTQVVNTSQVGEPNGVAGLGDNGAVPVAQGGTGATTVQGVVDAFGIFLAISAAAAYDPEGSYAVGDYCTHGGKLHKCNTPIESGEAWNAEHWTETTIAAELAAVKTELSNKLGLMNGTYTDLSAMPERPHMYLTPASGVVGLPDEWPQSPHDFVRLWCGNLAYTLDFIASYANKKLAYRMGQTQKWQVFVTATPPEVRNFTLQSGFTAGDCTFFVTQESAVFLAGGVSGTLPANQDTQIGTLPSDVCPSKQRRRPAVTNAGAAYIDIHTDGTVWAHPFVSASQCWFDTSFVAGGGS